MAREKFQTLTEQMFYILLCLRSEQCGADIMAQVRGITLGRVDVGPGTLYNLLESFLKAGMIAETKVEGRKRSYLITEAGEKALEDEYRRLQTLTADYEARTGQGRERTMKNTKRELPMFSFYNYTGIQRHLEKRAQEGWRLIKAERGGWLYRRMEPKELHYAVVYFPEASQFDPGPTEGQQTLRDYCLAAGWEPVTDWGTAQIYCNPNPDPVPIETEPSIQLETIHKVMKKTQLLGGLIDIPLFLMLAWMYAKDLYWDPAEFLSSPSSLVVLLLMLTGILDGLMEIGGYFRWYLRSKRSIAEGGGCVTPPIRHWLLWILLGLAGVALLWSVITASSAFMGGFMVLHMLGLIGMIALTWKLTSYLKRKKFSRNANRFLTIGAIVALSFGLMIALTAGIFLSMRAGLTDREPAEVYTAHGMTWNVYRDDIPLRIEDLIDTDYTDWSTEAETQSTFLVSQSAYSQEPRRDNGRDQPDLEYTVSDARVSFLADYVWQGALRNHSQYDDEWPEERHHSFQAVDAAPWGADEAARMYWGHEPMDTWLVRWGDRIVELRTVDMKPISDAQAAIIGEKLGK